MCNSKKIYFMLPLLLGVLIFRVIAQTGENSSVSKTGDTTSLGLSGSASVSLEALESFDKNVASARAAYGKELKIEPMDAGVKITKKAVIFQPENEGAEYVLSGYFKGQIINRKKNTVLKLKDAYLENTVGLPPVYGEAKTELSCAADSVNYVVSTGKSQDKVAAIQCRKNLVLGGSGTLFVKGGVYHGIKADGVKIKGKGCFVLQGTKHGAAVNCNTFTVEEGKDFTACLMNSKNGIKADEAIKIASGNFILYKDGTGLKVDAVNNGEENGILLTGGTISSIETGKLYSANKNRFTNTGARLLDQLPAGNPAGNETSAGLQAGNSTILPAGGADGN